MLLYKTTGHSILYVVRPLLPFPLIWLQDLKFDMFVWAYGLFEAVPLVTSLK